MKKVAFGLFAVLFAGCIAPLYATPQPVTIAISRKTFPIAELTPGLAMTDNASLVCEPGYSKSARDVPISEWNTVFEEYGVSYHPPGAFEIDHLIPICAGGSNSIWNLWAEPAEPRPGFHEKDILEACICRLICEGKVEIKQAQSRIAKDWLSWYEEIKDGCN